MFLFLGGFIISLLGLSCAGQTYPWKSAHVLATMIIGGLILIAFGLWETYANLKEPLLPMHLFKKFAWVVAYILLGIGACIYYALTIIWPTIVAVLYTDNVGASMHVALVSSVPSVMMNVGQIVSGFRADPIGKAKIQCIVVLTIGSALLGTVAAATPDTKNMAMGLILVSTFFIGWNEQACLSNAGIELVDQCEIGTAVGAAGSIRFAISSVGQAVYLSVLTNRLSQTIPAAVPLVLINAGLTTSSIPGFLAGLMSGSFEGVKGLTTEIIGIRTRTYLEAIAHAYNTGFSSTIALTGFAVILSIWSPNVDDNMDRNLAVTLHHTAADNGMK